MVTEKDVLEFLKDNVLPDFMEVEDIKKVELNTKLCETGLDSLDLVEIIMVLEEKYEIEIKDDEFRDYKNMYVQHIIKLVTEKVK